MSIRNTGNDRESLARIAADITGIRGYSRTMSSRSFRIGRSVTGLGLFATKPIKRGADITAYRGRRITTEEADRRAARGASYMFELNKRWTIDGSPRWNVARYINHSCRPNAKPVGRRGGIVIVALRRIEPGEEITYDYGREYVKCFLENGGCRCAACRRKRALRRRRARRREPTK
jgi:SET domain-containing protein